MRITENDIKFLNDVQGELSERDNKKGVLQILYYLKEYLF